MKTFFDCIPCFVRQAVDSVRLITDDEEVHERLIREVLRTASEMDLRRSPPEMGQRIHRLIRELTGNKDPYREMKDRATRYVLDMYPKLRSRVLESERPLETALRLAIAGNSIDLGVKTHFDLSTLEETIEHALSAPLNGDVEAFAEETARAERILYLADNAGEIVFDRLLLEQMPAEKTTLAVRGFPVINDVTPTDIQATGIPGLVEVIDNGSDAPGSILDDCSAEFRRRFDEADLVVSKGQGNYETLSETPKNIFFVLKAKCSVIARELGCPVGSLILKRAAGGMGVSRVCNSRARRPSHSSNKTRHDAINSEQTES